MICKKVQIFLLWSTVIFLFIGDSFLIQAAPIDETEARKIAVKWGKILNLPEMKPLATQKELKATITFTRAESRAIITYQKLR